MEIPEIFTSTGYAFLSRWTHFLAGITWIGLLYYFNFVQVPAFAEMEAGARSEALRKVTLRALWWFRWGAALTILSGFTILFFSGRLFFSFADGFAWEGQQTLDYFASAGGISILTGAALGTAMFLNVWVVIWPAQKIVIGSAETVAGGGEADPSAAPAGRRALLASRANTLFSIPLLFFMAATTHLAGFGQYASDLESGRQIAYWAIFVVAAGAVELSALGQLVGYDPGWHKWPFDSVRNVIISGFVLLIVFYAVFEVLFQA